MNRQDQLGLAEQLREVRKDLYGEHGVQFLADALDILPETWLNYEAAVTMPADIVLKLIVTARVSPNWLLTGHGEKYDY